jgi:hypothetical protein
VFPVRYEQNLYMLKLKLIYDRHSVGQSALVSGAHLGPLTNFSFAMKFSVDSCDAEESRPPLWSSGQSSWLHNGDVLCFL